jgi:hypothetical protein
MKLYIMQTGLWMDAEYPVPFPAYLIQTDDGKNILVDSGPDERYVDALRDKQWKHLIKVDESDRLINQLKAIGKRTTSRYLLSTPNLG